MQEITNTPIEWQKLRPSIKNLENRMQKHKRFNEDFPIVLQTDAQNDCTTCMCCSKTGLMQSVWLNLHYISYKEKLQCCFTSMILESVNFFAFRGRLQLVCFLPSKDETDSKWRRSLLVTRALRFHQRGSSARVQRGSTSGAFPFARVVVELNRAYTVR